jgi:uncharacterized protein DUF1707
MMLTTPAEPVHTRCVQEHDLAVRVSDADREAAVEALREHFFAGRLDVEEFTERIEEAYAARTVGELDEVERGLPASAYVAPPRRKPWLLPGNQSFAVRIHSRKPPAEAIEDVLRDVFTRLTGVGYHLREEEPTKRVFTRSQHPTWTIVVAVLLFPFGLFALMYRERSQVVLSATPVESGLTVVEVYGTAPLPVRRAIRDRAMLEPD